MITASKLRRKEQYRSRYVRMNEKLAAKNLYESGVSITDICTQTGKSRATITRWLKSFEVYRVFGTCDNVKDHEYWKRKNQEV